MIIRDPSVLIGSLEGGQLNQALSNEFAEVFRKLHDLSTEDQKKNHKGSVTLKLSLAAENGSVTISADIKSDTPKQPRPRSFYWITENGELSTEHPRQHDMFNGPRVTGQRSAEPTAGEA